jgi:hypothetical protein
MGVGKKSAVDRQSLFGQRFNTQHFTKRGRTMKKYMALALAMAGLLSMSDVASAAPRGGAGCQMETVRAHSTDTFNVTFYASQLAGVTVIGDGDTDLDVYIYDEFGNLIGSDTDHSDNCVVMWTPRWTGRFAIKVVNRGSVYNRYQICFH